MKKPYLFKNHSQKEVLTGSVIVEPNGETTLHFTEEELHRHNKFYGCTRLYSTTLITEQNDAETKNPNPEPEPDPDPNLKKETELKPEPKQDEKPAARKRTTSKTTKKEG